MRFVGRSVACCRRFSERQPQFVRMAHQDQRKFRCAVRNAGRSPRPALDGVAAQIRPHVQIVDTYALAISVSPVLVSRASRSPGRVSALAGCIFHSGGDSERQGPGARPNALSATKATAHGSPFAARSTTVRNTVSSRVAAPSRSARIRSKVSRMFISIHGWCAVNRVNDHQDCCLRFHPKGARPRLGGGRTS